MFQFDVLSPGGVAVLPPLPPAMLQCVATKKVTSHVMSFMPSKNNINKAELLLSILYPIIIHQHNITDNLDQLLCSLYEAQPILRSELQGPSHKQYLLRI